MKFRLIVYTTAGRMQTMAATVERAGVTKALHQWIREQTEQRMAYALMVGTGTPGLSNVYGVVIPPRSGKLAFTIRTISELQLSLTPPQEHAHAS